MSGRRRLCCGSLLLLVLAGQLLLLTRLRGNGVMTERVAAYLGEGRGSLRQLVSAPDSAPRDGSAPDSTPGDGSAPDSTPGGESAPDSVQGGGSAPDYASDAGSVPVTVPGTVSGAGSAPDSSPAAASAYSADSADSDSDSTPENVLDGSPPHLIIILSSSPRSGSSLLGEILSTSPNTAYFFEPFYYHVKNNMSVSRLPASEVQETLRLLLTCQLNRTAVLREAKYRRFIWRPAPRLRITPSTAVLARRCAAATTRVVKLVRPRLSQLLPLLQDAELGPRIRLVHLVRDPRGTLNSQLHASNVWSKLEKGLNVYCNGLRADLAAARSLRDPRYQRVHYEELALQPEQVAVELYRGMRLSQPTLLHAYFQKHMNSTEPEPEPAPVRGRAATQAGWRGPPLPAGRRSERRVAPSRAKRMVLPAGRQPAKYQLHKLDKNTQQKLQQRLRQQQQQRRIRSKHIQYFSTYRGPGFDPYHWRKELKPEVLRQLEHHCADVIAELETEVLVALGRTAVTEPRR